MKPSKEENHYQIITSEDHALFLQAMRNVKPLRTTHAVHLPSKQQLKITRPKKIESALLSQAFPESLLLDPNELTLTSQEQVTFKQAGVTHKKMRQLQTCYFGIEARCDLHGATISTAKQYLLQFLKAAQARHLRSLLIIHGKGEKINNPKPILKNYVTYWLKQHPAILALCSAQPRDGGSGALYVLLRGIRA